MKYKSINEIYTFQFHDANILDIKFEKNRVGLYFLIT